MVELMKKNLIKLEILSGFPGSVDILLKQIYKKIAFSNYRKFDLNHYNSHSLNLII